MIQIQNFVFNPFMENTYVLYDETKEAIVVDPGCYEQAEKDELTDFIESNELKVVKLINTHCHIDHVFGNAFVKKKYGVSLTIHKEDEATLKSVEVYAPAYGFQNFENTEAEVFFDEGDQVEFGNSVLDVFFTPGHAPGHVVLVNQVQKICIGGDVLFDGSIGRTDLPGGDFDTLIKSIHDKVFTLNDDTVVYPGHGGTTTVGKEKVSNPFCALSK
ncbi:Glyoxylase, beta-lactamase superfamily II [Reichenbachiella faecimaris]|uniref:Glyoxylase, beta-lactamase superfamily II n=1 Tax=Reichenbachiella faecimaris TaxID=692418 RepID=A0A1W2GFC3_REIFA|nr:MBL fold metallo-hydrolase [Reichenbachiella faecimaris]SMD35048.1 Glyoxylase, beta-lactamase superfamily II [Reichenbachiella faecimaris]